MVMLSSGAATPPPENFEFYFGKQKPTSAGAGAILDDGTGFQHHANNGLDYGWDCQGDAAVDYTGGRRDLDYDNGLGINHFDRAGTCPGKVNWQIAVPNGVYTAAVDFGMDDRWTHGCEVEGGIVCPNGGKCIFYNTVWVTDGYFTITGYSHDVGTCHSVSMVKLSSGATAPPPENLEFYFGTDLPASAGSGAMLADGLGFQHHGGTYMAACAAICMLPPPPIAVADANDQGGCGPVIVENPDTSTASNCDREYSLGSGFSDFLSTYGPGSVMGSGNLFLLQNVTPVEDVILKQATLFLSKNFLTQHSVEAAAN
jgi:hypothetical protein